MHWKRVLGQRKIEELSLQVVFTGTGADTGGASSKIES